MVWLGSDESLLTEEYAGAFREFARPDEDDAVLNPIDAAYRTVGNDGPVSFFHAAAVGTSYSPEPAPGDGPEYIPIVQNGASDNRIDIWFVGDGYLAADRDLFIADVTAQFEAMLATSDPFGQYAAFFNVHAVFQASAERGADRPGSGIYVDTAFNASYSWRGSVSHCLYLEERLANSAIEAVIPQGVDIDARLGSINAERYGGCGGAYGVYAAGHRDATELALHELGHSYADLDDEYWSSGSGTYIGGERSSANITTDPTGAKWDHWIGFHDGELGIVGVYEGGRYYEDGLYRPTGTSKMRALNKPFNAVSKEAFILQHYEEVDPVDRYAFEDVVGNILNPAMLWVETVDDRIFDIEWFLDGEVLEGVDGGSLDVNALELGTGDRTITAVVTDPTPLVRIGLESLTQTINWVVTTSGSIINGTEGAEQLTGTATHDDIRGLGGDDTLDGALGDDTLEGAAGNDLLFGGAGDDLLAGDTFDNALV